MEKFYKSGKIKGNWEERKKRTKHIERIGEIDDLRKR